MKLRAFNESTGAEVAIGDEVVSKKGERATLTYLSRPRIPGKSGKVVVRWAEYPDTSREYYDSVFDLRVEIA